MKNIIFASLITFLFIGCNKEVVTNGRFLSSEVFQMDRMENVFFTHDGGFIISGVSNSKTTIIKTDSQSDILWTQNSFDWGTNSSSGNYWGASFYSVNVVKIFQRNDGGYVCICSVEEGGDVVYSSTLIVQLNQRGEQIRKVEFTDIDAYNALETNDGGYLIFGNKLLKLDYNYNQIWQKNIFDFIYFQAQIVTIEDGGFATTGSYGDHIFLNKYDSRGNEFSSSTYKHDEYSFDESGSDLIQLDDKGFLIVGRSRNSDSAYDFDFQIIRTNFNGDTMWTKRFGYPTYDRLDRIISCNRKECIIQGTIGYPGENPKSYLLKINLAGQILDSCRTDNGLNLVCSPLNQYFRIQNTDKTHLSFSKVAVDKLFN